MLKKLSKKPVTKKTQAEAESEVGRQEQHSDAEMEDLENKKHDSGVHEEKEQETDKNGNQRQQTQNQIQISINKDELNLESEEESMSGSAAGSEAEQGKCENLENTAMDESKDDDAHHSQKEDKPPAGKMPEYDSGLK